MKKHLLYFLASIFIGLPAFVSAQTPPGVGATITVPSSSNSQFSQFFTTSSLQTFLKDLKMGVSGDEVKTLQKFLSTMPDIYPEHLVTGFYGSLTKKAIER